MTSASAATAYAKLWRGLAFAAIHAADRPEESAGWLGARTGDAMKAWNVNVVEKLHARCQLAALPPLCRAYAKTPTIKERAALAPAVLALAEACRAHLGDGPIDFTLTPGGAPRAPRADLEG